MQLLTGAYLRMATLDRNPVLSFRVYSARIVTEGDGIEGEKEEFELEILAPAQAKPGEEIKVKAAIKGGRERRTIRRLKLVATIEWHEPPYGYIGRYILHIDPLWFLGFFGCFRRLIAEYVFRGIVGRSPVRKIVLARNMELMPRAREEYDLMVKLLAPELAKPGYFWRLRLAARIPFAQDSFADAYIRPIFE